VHNQISMKKLINFIDGTIEELKTNVTWSSWSEVQNSSFIVVVATIIFAIIVGVIDFSFKYLINSIN
jgi:preprotein translocase subunit SecE